jgi:glycosyltransferase involved in cell wall biosynthesis
MSLLLLLGTELEVDVEQGHEVFGISAPGPYVAGVEDLGVTHIPIPELTRSWAPAQDLTAFRRLVATLRDLDLDVLHTHNPKTGVMGRVAGRLAGVPVVVNTCHGLWAGPGDRLRKRAFVYGLEAFATRFSDYELFQNAQDRATLRPVLKRGRHRVVGNGVDLGRFAPDPVGRRRVREELGIADDELLVGAVGRRVLEKGLVEFGQAASSLRDRATFVWVGPEDDTDPRQPSGLDSVRFLGERSDMPAVYSALDVFVLASYREGFSRAAMEAAACGAPMVLTDIRGCREIGTDGVHLLLTPPHDGAALARAVGGLLDDPELRTRLGRAAEERARREFDQRSVARASLETYAAVVRRKGPDLGRFGDPRTRVLHVLPRDRDRGAQVFAGRLRDDLNAGGDQVHAVVTLFRGPDAAAVADVKLDVPAGPLARLGLDPRAVMRLRREIRRRRASVVVAHGGEALKYVVAARPRAATIYKRTGLSSAEVSRPSRVRLYMMLSAQVTHVVGVSQALLEQSHVLMGVPRARLSLIPNGRDPEVYRPPRDVEPRLVPPLVLYVGHLEGGKRPDLFLDVVELLRARSAPFQAAIVGEGPLRSSLSDRAAELGVDMLGNRTDVPELLRAASVLVFTSEPASEGMPGVLIEAGLSGLPTVSTAAAGVTDVLVDGETGFVVRSDRAEDLAVRVDLLLRDPALRTLLGDAGRERCAQAFTLSAATRQWHDLVERLAVTSLRVNPRSRRALSCQPVDTGMNSEQPPR